MSTVHVCDGQGGDRDLTLGQLAAVVAEENSDLTGNESKVLPDGTTAFQSVKGFDETADAAAAQVASTRRRVASLIAPIRDFDAAWDRYEATLGEVKAGVDRISVSASDHQAKIASQSRALHNFLSKGASHRSFVENRRGHICSSNPSFFDSRGILWLNLTIAVLFFIALVVIIIAKLVQ